MSGFKFPETPMWFDVVALHCFALVGWIYIELILWFNKNIHITWMTK